MTGWILAALPGCCQIAVGKKLSVFLRRRLKYRLPNDENRVECIAVLQVERINQDARNRHTARNRSGTLKTR